MRALLLIPEESAVQVLELPPARHSGLLRAMHNALKCTCLCAFRPFPTAVTAYCDDTGLLTATGKTHVVVFRTYAQPVVGRVLLLGPPDHEGYDTPCTLTRDYIETNVVFGTVQLPAS